MEVVGEQLTGGRVGLRLADNGKTETGGGEGIGHRVQWPAPEPHRDGLPIERPVEGIAGGREVVGPRIGDRVGPKGWVHRRDQPAAGPEHSPQLGQRRPPVLQVVQHQRRDHVVERTVGERQRVVRSTTCRATSSPSRRLANASIPALASMPVTTAPRSRSAADRGPSRNRRPGSRTAGHVSGEG
jgi:hypothetical protein